MEGNLPLPNCLTELPQECYDTIKNPNEEPVYLELSRVHLTGLFRISLQLRQHLTTSPLRSSAIPSQPKDT